MISTVWAYVLASENGGEQIVVARMGDVRVPLITADEEKLRDMRLLAAMASADHPTERIRLVRFVRAGDEDVVTP